MTKVLDLLEVELPKYIHEVKSKNQENAKAVAFSSFIQKVFQVESKDLDFEVPVKTEVLQLRGRIDTVFGNLIIEFKRDLRKSIDEAEEELLKYFQSYKEKFPDNNYLGIANDGIDFIVYQPIFENNIIKKMEIISEFNLEKANTLEVFLWFDSYFFTSDKIQPTSQDLKRRFGLDSPTYLSLKTQLLELFDKVKDDKPVNVKYESWRKYLEIVYGDKPQELELFMKHTYLSTLVKILVHLKLSGYSQNRYDDILPILYGNTFTQFGIQNFLEEDFFVWIMFLPIRKKSSKLFSKLLLELEVYDLEQVDEDVLKELYQEIVDPEVRKQLGEFYTPDWLADDIVKKTLKNGAELSVLDPSCGSGTFLFKTIRYKIQELSKKKWSKSRILEHILISVVGFDIHPLAAIISKTNYLLALKDLLSSRKSSISIPVFLSDSLKIPTKKMHVTHAVTTFEFEALNKRFLFPIDIARDFSKMDFIVEQMKNHGQDFELQVQRIEEKSYAKEEIIPELYKNLVASFERSISDKVNDQEKEILIDNIRTLYDFILSNEDSIWTYVIRNMYKPIGLMFKKTDVIIGNPPWISLRHIKNEIYQNYVKERSKHYGLLDSYNFQNIANMELASLFFCQCIDNYLNDGGFISFVMPQSIIIASQHKNFVKFENPQTKLLKTYDLEYVDPLFRIPSCVIFAKKNEVTKYPVPMIKMSGKLPSNNLQLEDATKILKIEKTQYLPQTRKKKGGYYYDIFQRGAEITPRNFWFVDIESSKFLSFNPENPHVKSAANRDSKKPWKDIKMSGNIERQFFFNSILGPDIIPFGYLRRRMVIIPIVKNRNQVKMIDSNELAITTYDFKKYLEKVEEHWIKNATEKLKKKPIYDQINYNGNLINQKPDTKYKVIYAANGANMTCTVVKSTENYVFKIGESEFETDRFFVDMAMYYANVDSENEAYYLSAILNSHTINEFIKPHQSRGDFGPRNIHKTPLTFDIPKFDPKNKTHLSLVKIGKKCHIKSLEIVSKLNLKGIGTIRNRVREGLNEEMEEIDKLISKF